MIAKQSNIEEIVMAFGTFDGLHTGHRYFLQQAKNLGDHLIVVVARDETVEELKQKKTWLSLEERIDALEKTQLAYKVVPGDIIQGSWNVLKTHQPSIIAIGHDQHALREALLTYKEKLKLNFKISNIRKSN